MTKRVVNGYFSAAPTAAEAQARVKEMSEEIAVSRGRPRPSKLEPHIPMISTYLRETQATLGMIVRELGRQHKLPADKSTLSRFIRSHPGLAGLRPAKTTTVKTRTQAKL